MGDNTSWADLNKDGRRLERIIKQMDTKQKLETDKDLQLAYIDRLLKATMAKSNIAYSVLKVKDILKKAEKTFNTESVTEQIAIK